MRGLLKYLKAYKRESVIAPLFKMLEAGFDLLVPLVMASIIDVGIAAGDRGYILSGSGALILLGLIGLACSITAQYFAAKAAVGFGSELRRALFVHIQSLGFSEADTLGTSTLITRMTSDIQQVQNGLNLFLRLFLRSPFIVLGSVAMAFFVDVKAALIFVAVIPALSAVVFGLMYVTMPLYRRVQGRLDALLGVVRENLTGVRVIRAFNREQGERERFEGVNRELLGGQLSVGRLSALMNPLTYAIVNLSIVAILQTGAVRIQAGEMLPGAVIALVNYMGQVLVELVKLANLIVQVTRALACGGRVAAILDVEPKMKFEEKWTDASGGNDARVRADGDAADAVAFEHVSFSYEGAAGESLSDISFTAKRGQTVGVIGGTGSGKSTLVNLIPRFYDATQGNVRIEGRDVRTFAREELRRKVGVVLQRAQLFSGTIRSNLLWGNRHATDEELWAALETAQAAGFVREKKMGLDEPVEQGGRNLSGGQRQRLTIARALVAEPNILILDDSASALDYATDAALRKSIGKLGDALTVFIVSQRAASLRHADVILVLEDGQLVGRGSHEELLAGCSVYREIYESQFRKAGEA